MWQRLKRFDCGQDGPKNERCWTILIHVYFQQDAALHSLFYLETVLHVSGDTITHHQQRKQLYLQHLVFVTPLLLTAAIVEELEPVWVCCGWRTNDTVCNAACSIAHSIICTRLLRGKMHSDWFNGIEILQGRWQYGEKSGILLSQRTWKDSL
jgi:hypothetical protein